MSIITPPGRGARPAGENDVYSALMLVACLCILTATIYVLYRSAVLFGSPWPAAGG